MHNPEYTMATCQCCGNRNSYINILYWREVFTNWFGEHTIDKAIEIFEEKIRYKGGSVVTKKIRCNTAKYVCYTCQKKFNLI